MNVLYVVRKSDETNQLLKNRQDKNRCDAMVMHSVRFGWSCNP